MKRACIVWVGGFLFAAALMSGCSKEGEKVAAVDTTRYEYDLSRILFLLPEVYDLPATNEVRDIIWNQKRGVALKSEYQKQLKAAKIVEHNLNPSLQSTNDFALITYNGKTLYNSEILKDVRMKLHLEQLKTKKLSKSQRVRITRDVLKKSVAFFVNTQAYSDYAKEHGISIPENEISSNRVLFAKQYRCKDYQELCKKLPADEVQFLDRRMREALITHDARKAIEKAHDLSVSQEEIVAALARFEKIHEIAVATNALIYATASNVYSRIQSREITFEEAFQDYNQDEDADDEGAWCTVSLNQLTHDDQYALVEHLRTAKVGDVLPPMELDNALCIVKVTGKRAATDKEEEKGEADEGETEGETKSSPTDEDHEEKTE